MSFRKIQILDYGSGNLFSIKNSLERLSKLRDLANVDVAIDSRYPPAEGTPDALILPGVGSFSSAQRVLGENREPILCDVRERRLPILGICLGMQLLFESSEEGAGEGLKLLRGRVRRLSPAAGCKVPHMGWNTISPSREAPPSEEPRRLTEGLCASEWVYYVHSYFPEPEDLGVVEAWSEYAGTRFPAIVSHGNVFGTQFHPEKSHDCGARILSNFLAIVGQKKA